MNLPLLPAARLERSRSLPWRLCLFGLSAVVAFAYGFLTHTAAEAGALIQSYGYYVMTGTGLWWLVTLVRLWSALSGAPRIAWRKEHGHAVILIGILWAVSVLTVPFSTKVLYDEFVLQATSWSLHFNREFCTLLRGYEVEGVFRSVAVMVDKRPFFYPFVVSLLHDLTGYRLSNAYWLNTALFPVALGLIYAVAYRLAGKGPALAALACFGASALLAQNANGAGMEMLNLVMFLLTLGLAIYYLEKPAEDRLTSLILSCILLAQTRYESALYVMPTALVILEGWRRAGRIILPPVAQAAPLLLIPCALHNTYLAGTPFLWELREDVTSRFDHIYLVENLTHAARYFFDFSRRLLSSWWLSTLGLGSLMGVIVVFSRRKKSWKEAGAPETALILFGLAAVANLGLLMFYFWGQLDDPLVSRLVLPFNVILAAAIAWALRNLAPYGQLCLDRWVLAGALFTYMGFGLTASAYNRTINQQAWEISWEEKWLAKLPPASRLVITNKSSLGWVLQDIPSIDVGRARYKAAQIRYHLKAGTFQEVLVSQYLRPTSIAGEFIMDPRDQLPPVYVLEPLVERQVGAKLLRISRVVEIKDSSDQLLAPARVSLVH